MWNWGELMVCQNLLKPIGKIVCTDLILWSDHDPDGIRTWCQWVEELHTENTGLRNLQPEDPT